jgi:hypothetical protein
LVERLDAHPELSYDPSSPADPDVEYPSRIVEAYDAASERLLDQHKEQLAAVRRQLTAFARQSDHSDRVSATRSAVTKHANAVKRLDRRVRPAVRHLLAGTHRLFRSRKDTERRSGPALVFYEGCRIVDNHLVLPGGIRLRLPRSREGEPFSIPSGMTWNGALHIVDLTDQAGRVTRYTTFCHRKYRAHLLCRNSAPAPVEPSGPDEVVGIDWGVAHPLVDSRGQACPKYATDRQRRAGRRRHHQARRLQQSMSDKTEGSRRYRKQQRQRGELIAKNTNVRINQQRHNAKAVVTQPGVVSISTERTNTKNMTAGAVGSKAHPARSSGKRGLNRSLSETAPSRMLGYISGAAVKHSVGHAKVNPAYTSRTCFICGAVGQRETQALFHCPSCGNTVNADVQAALNIEERGHPDLYPPTGGGRDSRRKMLDDAMGTFLSGVSITVSEKASQTNTPVHSGI